MRVMRYRREPEGIDDPKTWIARIAWRVAIEQAKKRPGAAPGEKEMAQAISRLRAGGKTAEELAASSEMASVLESLISSLPDSLRHPMRLSTLEELLPGEIAEMLRTSEASVRSRLFRARQILKDKLRALEVQNGVPK